MTAFTKLSRNAVAEVVTAVHLTQGTGMNGEEGTCGVNPCEAPSITEDEAVTLAIGVGGALFSGNAGNERTYIMSRSDIGRFARAVQKGSTAGVPAAPAPDQYGTALATMPKTAEEVAWLRPCSLGACPQPEVCGKRGSCAERGGQQ